MKRYTFCFLISFFGLLTWGCEDFVAIDAPRTEIVRETIFSSDESATAAINGLYAISNTRGTVLGSELVMCSGLLADEFTFLASWSDFYVQSNKNDITANNEGVLSLWNVTYNAIYNANSILEGLEENTLISREVRDQLVGEAYFMRAYLHFNLTNFFGDIPYVETTEVEANNAAIRLSTSEVYDRIISDLLQAQDLMVDNYDFHGLERIRPIRYAATALLARVYLYLENWTSAEAQATSVIENSDLFQLESDLNEVFIAGSEEAIFQLASIGVFGDIGITPLGDLLVITGRPRTFTLAATALNNQLLAVFSEADMRRSAWTGTFTSGLSSWNFSNKYKNNQSILVGPPEYNALFRLAEQYLIRSEARAQLGSLSGALDDLKIIRSRAGLSDTILVDATALLDAVMLERQRELFAEGHRWFDLKRTVKADEVLGAVKEGWEPSDVLLPVPEQELLNNANLGPQNQGY